MIFLFDRLYRRFGPAYFVFFLVFEVLSSATVTLATVGLFTLYEDVSAAQFWRALVVAEISVTIALVWTLIRSMKLLRPLIAWIKGGRGPEGALEAWALAVTFPRRAVVENGWLPFAVVSLPIAILLTADFGLPFYSAGIIFAGTLVAIGYASILNFFAVELALRPVVRDIVGQLPPDFEGVASGVPLRWKLLGALPLINVITGVVVSGLSRDATTSLNDLGVDVVVAVLVAFTLSFELTLLLTKSVLEPVDELIHATERLRAGDLSVRVPVTSADELGALAASFNRAVTGLQERETLQEAFGSYVDPGVAERVLEEGALLEGEEVEASMLFVDIRGFTAFAERSSAREVVAHLNRFFDLIVPILLKHGGHANKFVGDGLLGVFGAPDRHRDHADRALGAAWELARAVEREFGDELSIGVGVNSGPVMVGSIGGGGRLEFTVIGDPVNVAARVEAATRETGDTVLITEATRCLLEHSAVELQPRGSVELKGISEPVPIYAPRLASLASSAAAETLSAGTT